MTIHIETPTRAEVTAERDRLVAGLSRRFGSSDRNVLRERSVSGDMTMDEAADVRRLGDLDFLLSGK